VPLDEAALLGCAALTGVGAVLFAAGVEDGSTVLVVGAGGVGQFVVQGARIAGATEIVCVDPIEERLKLAQRLGATRVVQPDGLASLMKESLPDGVDYAFDAVGDPATTKTAFRWTRNGGLTVIVGLPALGAKLELDPTEFIRREKALTGTIYGSEDPAVALPILLGHVRSGALELSTQLGPRFSLDDANDAVEAALAGVPGRVLVVP
jgi:S-(hydroxymethyl)glutathione dehydrogenase / alcohol dehydrogenase